MRDATGFPEMTQPHANIDWRQPTNAVPGVQDTSRGEDIPNFPVLTLMGFGGKTYTIRVPETVRNMPGMGEDYASSPKTSREEDGEEGMSPCPGLA